MRFALLFALPLLVACSVADEPPQIESDASACVTLTSCGCTAGTTYKCPSGEIVTCQDGGTWPEAPCMSGDAGVDATAMVDATTDTAEATPEPDGNSADTATDSPAD
jgi:hypothetical protein